MLSIANVGNGKAAASYYEKADDYYTKGHAQGEWWGLGAEFMDLKGGVDPEVFALVNVHAGTAEAEARQDEVRTRHPEARADRNGHGRHAVFVRDTSERDEVLGQGRQG